MKARIWIFLALISLFHAPALRAETIALATGEWIPYTSSGMEQFGEFTEQVTIVLAEMGVQPEYRFYPWPRCFDSVLKGRVWAAFPYSHTEERAKKVLFSAPLSCSKTVFFYYGKDSDKKPYRFDRLEDLRDYIVGGVAGYFYEELFQKAGLDVDYASDEISGLEKLKRGRVDLMPVNEKVGRHLIQTHFPDDIDRFHTLSRSMSVDSLHLIVSKSYPDAEKILRRFNAALQQCREKGLVHIPECR